MRYFTYIGDHPETYPFGMTFKQGEATPVSDQKIINKLLGNKTFKEVTKEVLKEAPKEHTREEVVPSLPEKMPEVKETTFEASLNLDDDHMVNYKHNPKHRK